MNDFETVRSAILSEWEGTHGVIGEGKEILAALDRIEAEFDAQTKSLEEACEWKAEVERLRALLRGAEHDRDMNYAKFKREQVK